jgi:hypothetical protein
MAVTPGIYDVAQQFMASPEYRLAYQGIAGQTLPAQRVAGTAPAVAPQPVRAVAVPGRTAQAVTPSPVDAQTRIATGFDAANGMKVDPALAAALQARVGQGSAAATAPSTSGDTSWVDDVVSGATASGNGQSDAGLLGRYLPTGIRNPISDALTGLTVGNPTAPPAMAFAQGFAGAQAAQQARLDRKRQEQAAEQELEWKQEDRAYQRERDATADDRDDRKMTLDERRADRDDRKAALDELSTAAGIQHTLAETNKIVREYQNNGLTVDQQIKVEGLVNDYIKAQLGDYPTESDRQSIKADADTYRSNLIQQFKGGSDISGATGGTTEVPKDAVGGTGTTSDPLSFPGSTSGTAESILQQKYQETGQPVYFRDETGQLREYAPGP